MATLETWMPHDMKAAERYLEQSLNLRKILSETGSKALTSLADQLTAATMSFGRCELHMRVAERNGAIDTRSGQVPGSTKRAMDHQAKGLQALEGVEKWLGQLTNEAKQLDGQDAGKSWGQFETEMKSSWQEAIADLDMKPSDARKLQKVMEECCQAGSKGMTGMAEHIGRQFQELKRLRKTPSRGTEDNWPWWKIVAAAVWVGMTVYGVYDLLINGAPWWSAAMVILIGLLGTILIILGC